MLRQHQVSKVLDFNYRKLNLGFQLSKAQPGDDPRPYLQYILFASVLGADAENFELFGDKFGYDSQVKCQ